mgnify:CR=1 FL=1
MTHYTMNNCTQFVHNLFAMEICECLNLCQMYICIHCIYVHISVMYDGIRFWFDGLIRQCLMSKIMSWVDVESNRDEWIRFYMNPIFHESEVRLHESDVSHTFMNPMLVSHVTLDWCWIGFVQFYNLYNMYIEYIVSFCINYMVYFIELYKFEDPKFGNRAPI